MTVRDRSLRDTKLSSVERSAFAADLSTRSAAAVLQTHGELCSQHGTLSTGCDRARQGRSRKAAQRQPGHGRARFAQKVYSLTLRRTVPLELAGAKLTSSQPSAPSLLSAAVSSS